MLFFLAIFSTSIFPCILYCAFTESFNKRWAWRKNHTISRRRHFGMPRMSQRNFLVVNLPKWVYANSKHTLLKEVKWKCRPPLKLLPIRNVWILLDVPRKWKLIMAVFSFELNVSFFIVLFGCFEPRILFFPDAKQKNCFFSIRIFMWMPQTTPTYLVHFPASIWITAQS